MLQEHTNNSNSVNFYTSSSDTDLHTEVRVLNLSKETTPEELIEYFGFCGEIDTVSIADQGNFQNATIEFGAPGSAKTALLLSGSLVHGRRMVVVPGSVPEVAGTEGECTKAECGIEPKSPLQSLLGGMMETGHSVAERLWELDETYKISEYVKTLTAAMYERYEASGTAQAMRTAGAAIKNTATQTWTEALKLLGGSGGGGGSGSDEINYNIFSQA